MATSTAKPWSPPTTYAEVWQRYWDKVQGQIGYDEARKIHNKWVKLGTSV